MAEEGDHAILCVKTAHGRFPKKFLEEEMAEMPGGCWVVMEARAEREGVDLVAMGYKYNKKKVLLFVMTRGAASTRAGRPYKAKYNDAYGNVLSRDVARPVACNIYFERSNCVDQHNQARQHFLALEEAWVTGDGYFRQWTTFTGITATDLWYLKCGKKDDKEEGRRIVEFADELVWDLLAKAAKIDDSECNASNTPLLVDVGGCEQSEVSKLSSPSSPCKHTKFYLSKKGRSASGSKSCRFVGKQAGCIWCSRMHGRKNKTQLVCLQCNFAFCSERTGRTCWQDHINSGGVPEQVLKREKKRRLHDATNDNN